MAQVHAQASLSFQGALQKASGANFDDGEYAMTFRLYESETGGSAVWSETQDAVDVLGGVFNTLLGQVNPLNAAFDKTYFLGISVNYGVEMVPRIRLTASPVLPFSDWSEQYFSLNGCCGCRVPPRLPVLRCYT
jgi:hypothetical protein